MGVARRFAALATAATVLAGCSSAPTSATVDWYVTPGLGDTDALARACSGADVTIRVHELPADADARHTLLVRTLQADPASIDLLSVDGSSVPELAAAGFLTTQPADRVADLLPAAVESVTHDGDVAAVPWTIDPQLLWFRTVVAERAGIDTSEPVSWDDLIGGAERLGVTVQVADADGTGVAGWVATLGADDDAAAILERYRDAQVGPGPTDDAVGGFLAGDGGFLIAPGSALADPRLRSVIDQVGVVDYPLVADRPVVPGTVQALAVPEGAGEADQASTVIDCLTDPTLVRDVVVATGVASAQTAVLDDPALDELPTVDRLRTALQTVLLPSSTPYQNAIRRALDDTWSPLADVTDRTPAESRTAVAAATSGRLP